MPGVRQAKDEEGPLGGARRSWVVEKSSRLLKEEVGTKGEKERRGCSRRKKISAWFERKRMRGRREGGRGWRGTKGSMGGREGKGEGWGWPVQ